MEGPGRPRLRRFWVRGGPVNAPVRVARTAAGSVGYREVGRGSPLLLITGLGASMDELDKHPVGHITNVHVALVHGSNSLIHCD
jgi:hypothetical protein